jgi:hypothetical protein
LKNLVERVFDNDNECSDFSEDEIESEVVWVLTMNQVKKIVKEKNNDAPGPSKRIRTMAQKKQSDWKWTKTDNSPPQTLHLNR